jgi:SAM-dependent methyltransferase
MTQAYSESFARAYNRIWTDFADRAAPRILARYRATNHGRRKRPVLDLCCGTGTLALHFLAAGFPVTGVDASKPMLRYARKNARTFIRSGLAEFIEADVTAFEAPSRYGLAVSTFDSLNHLDGLPALGQCCARTFAALLPGGLFIFDLNTRRGHRRWDEIEITDEDEVMIVKRGGYDRAGGRAFYRVSGFLRGADGRYDRFEEMVVETAFELQAVEKMLADCCFKPVYFARAFDLGKALSDPEAEDRVFVVARKPGSKEPRGRKNPRGRDTNNWGTPYGFPNYPNIISR